MNTKPLRLSSSLEPFLIAGPCSAESESQVYNTASSLKPLGIDLFRAGIWKPRTAPGRFEGVGAPGLPWLQRVQQDLGMTVTTEVATARHVELCLERDIKTLWIGARTSVNPFSVQELADALRGTDTTVMVKNPINPDLGLWIGAIERIHRAGVSRLAAIHRGFSAYNEVHYRNPPIWQIPLELKQRLPQIPIITDNSHICGRRDTLFMIAQTAMDLQFDGLMTEVHPDPDHAWSDAAQQITPEIYTQLLDRLVLRRNDITEAVRHTLQDFRHSIDAIDSDLLDLVAQRMKIVHSIAKIKKKEFIPIFQPERWEYVLQRALAQAPGINLGKTFVKQLFHAIHQESILHQEQLMNPDSKRPADD